MASKILQNSLNKLYKEPVEGFYCELVKDENLFEWKIYLEGPKDTPYEGGIFQLIMSFTHDFPMSPPKLRFISDFWHPNVYPDGKVCISILHPPGDDPMSGELAAERWLPTQSVSSIMLSVISMLGDPNISSPANVDASVEWRDKRSNYISRCKRLCEKANKEAPSDISIPHPDSDPVQKQQTVAKIRAETIGFDFYDDDDVIDDDDDDNDDDDNNDDNDDNYDANSDTEENDGDDENHDSDNQKTTLKQSSNQETDSTNLNTPITITSTTSTTTTTTSTTINVNSATSNSNNSETNHQYDQLQGGQPPNPPECDQQVSHQHKRMRTTTMVIPTTTTTTNQLATTLTTTPQNKTKQSKELADIQLQV
eukprot:TRINITY_DN2246_c1_g1_i1.p1 TRINITY_DN2246_c1_g1~~TRINITY_DN2246_c1_g1_i1.p1  ORF type:complete len:367 (-),score=116.27 TRINITY_DN2246_c1_g1_i1:144-1244(-)